MGGSSKRRSAAAVLDGVGCCVERVGAGGLRLVVGSWRGSPGGSARGASGWASSHPTSKATLLALLPLLVRGILLEAIKALMAASVRDARLAPDGRPASAARR